jgi:hypothetical protein
VTLGRLVLAWLAVAAWITVASLIETAANAATPIDPSLLKWRLVEALVLTLLATLWFASLGSGGWWLPFLLFGVLAIGPRWLGAFAQPRTFVWLCADLARYVVAGAILAWMLR